MSRFTPIEFAFAAMALVMLALLAVDVYFDEDRVRRRRYKRQRLDLRAALLNRRGGQS